MFAGIDANGGFIRAFPPAPAPQNGPGYCFVFRKHDALLRADSLTEAPAPVEIADVLQTFPAQTAPLYLGTLDGVPCLAWQTADDAASPEDYQALGLRDLFGAMESDWAALAGYAHQILRWQRESKFCPKCGTATQAITGGWAKKCPNCGYEWYPPVSPAVLALIHDGQGRVLLAQKDGWATRWSILAGFVEPGESLEACVIREVKEEAGVKVGWPEYAGSQPWPFPHQVMVAFVAEWESGDIVIDETELARAAWFSYDALPDLPPPLSLSRRTIDEWAASEVKKRAA